MKSQGKKGLLLGPDQNVVQFVDGFQAGTGRPSGHLCG
jgi:hypothetical protein